MNNNWRINDTGLFTPVENSLLHDDLTLPDLPLFRFMMKNFTTAWVLNNFQAVWKSPAFDEVSSIWDITMDGIDIQNSDDFGSTTKGITISRMMTRSLSLARTSCWAMATGNPMDSLACYRMIFERALLLQYLDKNHQYEGFERFCWAEGYFWLADALASQIWRNQATEEAVQSFKDRQAVIRDKHFGGKTPKKPKQYWTQPKTNEMAEAFSLFAPYAEMDDNGELRRAMERLYELGSKAVHPRIGDLLEPQELGWSEDSEECMSLVVMALASVTMFGLSKHEKTRPLSHAIASILISSSQLE